MSQHIEITRIFDAPRELVYQAFTDPDQLAQWFGPVGCSVPRDSIEIDARPGGHLRFGTGARQRAGKQPPVQRRGTRSRAGQTGG